MLKVSWFWQYVLLIMDLVHIIWHIMIYELPLTTISGSCWFILYIFSQIWHFVGTSILLPVKELFTDWSTTVKVKDSFILAVASALAGNVFTFNTWWRWGEFFTPCAPSFIHMTFVLCVFCTANMLWNCLFLIYIYFLIIQFYHSKCFD